MASPQIALVEPPSGADIGYLHSVFCQVGLPRRRCAGREFTRRNGAAWMVVQAGFLDEGTGRVERAVPHGVMPRLLLAWICNEVTRGGGLELDLGSTPRELLRRLGLGGQAARCATGCTTWRPLDSNWAGGVRPSTPRLFTSYKPGVLLAEQSLLLARTLLATCGGMPCHWTSGRWPCLAAQP